MRIFMPLLVCAAVFACPVVVQAKLKPLGDKELSNITGQAFVSIDRQYNPDPTQNVAYTRVNLGMNVETQLNVAKLDLGHYNRNDTATGGEAEAPGSSDVLVNNFSLGYIQNDQYYQNTSAHPYNSELPRMLKPDGSAYQNGDIVPFTIKDPYLEFAYDQTTNDIVGVRLGFGQSEGVLSGNIKYMTGNVNVKIVDHGEGLKNAKSQGNLFDQMVKFLTPVLAGSSPLIAQAQLVHGAQNDPKLGQLDPVRAQYIGLPNGENFTLKGVSSLVAGVIKLISPTLSSPITLTNCNLLTCDVNAVAQNCQVLGIQACFPLSQYNSFPIGQITNVNGQNYITGPSSGLFMSFETKTVQWLKDVSKQNPTSSDYITAGPGAFFNIPSGSTQVNLDQALYGIQRYRTEYIDRGVGLF
ncbi:DUF6160 family protein [Mangrovitalea sediminis]|uniref:DUF6160 family protein n=1 Tax=Mangrovitalea sediminis TaxID=1982043 RepID=UPI001D0D3B51|nr:DUF6160 family protein [Mangrovitalea sediminis]